MRIKNITLALALGALLAPPVAKAQNIVTEPPAGGTVHMYDRSGSAYYVQGVSNKKTKEFSDLATELVEYPDGTVYMKNPVSQVAGDSYISAAANAYIRGTISGETMTFVLPQDLYSGTDWSNNPYVTQCVMLSVPANIAKTSKAASQTVTYSKQADGSWKMDGPSDGSLIMGTWGCFMDVDGWPGYGDWNVTLTPQAAQQADPVSFPAGATPEDWAAKYNGSGHFVKVYVDGDDIYIGSLFSFMPDAVVKATKQGDNYVIASGQYVGIDSFGSKEYFQSATYEVRYDAVKDRNYRAYVPNAGISFSYDATAKTLTCLDSEYTMLLCTDVAPEEVTLPMATLAVETIAWQPASVDHTPATPVLSDYAPYTAAEGEGWITFNLPATNSVGQLIDSSKIYWRVLMDDKVYEVKNENGHYYGVQGTLTEIPYTYTVSGIVGNGVRHTFSFYTTDFTFIGVQALYKDGDADPVYSEILSANGAAIPGVWTGEEPVAEIITEVPEGGTIKIFTRNGQGFIEDGIKVTKVDITDVVTEIVEYEDGTIYMRNPISEMAYDDGDSAAALAYIKGRKEGDKMTFFLPQPLNRGRCFVGKEWERDYEVSCVLVSTTATGGSPKQLDDNSFYYEKQADGTWKMMLPESAGTGIVSLGAWGRHDAPSSWSMYSEWDIVLTPDETPVPTVITKVPEGGTTAMYMRSGTAVYETGVRRAYKDFSDMETEVVTYPDGTVYLKNPVSQIGDDNKDSAAALAYIAGTYTDDTMTFALPQALYYGMAFNNSYYTTDCVMVDVDLTGSISAEKAQNQTLVFKKNDEGAWVMQGTAAIGAWGRYDGPANFTNYCDLAVVLTPAKAPEIPTEVIRQAPEGETTVYSRSGSAWVDKTTRKETMQFSDVATEVVTCADGKVYLKNPVSQKPTDSYIMGTYTDNTMTFAFPQPVDEGTMFNGDPYTSLCQLLTVDTSKSTTNPTVKPADNQILRFVKDAEGVWQMAGMESGDVILGIVGSFLDADAWSGYGDWNVSLASFAAIPDPVVVPASATVEKWAAKYSLVGRFVDVCFDGSDIYVRGLSKTLPDAAIKGSIEGGKAIFASPQYLGIDNAGNMLYLVATERAKGYDEDTEVYYNYFAPAPELIFAYDANAKTMATVACIIVADKPYQEEILSATESYDDMAIEWQPSEVELTPAAPILTNYSDTDRVIDFNLPAYNTAGQLIDTSAMYWQFIVDEEIYIIEDDGKHYVGIEGMTDVPYAFDTKLDIFATGARHTLLYFIDDYQFLGLRALYRDGDKDIFSTVTPVTGDMPQKWTSLDAISAGKVLQSRTYYDLGGRCVSNPSAGMYIVRDVYTDGTAATGKVILR